MGRKCMVPDCLSEEGRNEDRGVTFHKIPLHADIRPKWMTLCHIPEDKYNVKVIHVCSRHFLKANFYRFKGKKYMLKQGVLPSVFPWNKRKKENEIFQTEELVTSKSDVDDLSTGLFKDEVIEDVQIDEPIPPEIHKMEADLGEDIKEDIRNETILSAAEEIISTNNSKKDSSLEGIGELLMPTPAEPLTVTKKVEPLPGSSTTIEQQGKSIQTAFGTVNLKINSRLEALDFNQIWLPARMIEIDYEENEVLIHFEKYSSKHDEWINMNSSRLRPIQPPAKKVISEVYSIGEKCLASWSDNRKFPAVVTKVIDKDTYEVLFNDGFVKVLKAHRMAKADGKTVGSAPLFDPAEGTKQDRREKKRKLNVAQLFRKRVKVDTSEDTLATAVATSDEGVASPNEESDLFLPKWENGKPIGVESVIETSDGIRKSIIVPDPKLPIGWQKHLTQRIHGASAGKWDTVLVSPEGRRFRTRAEIKAYLEENPHLNYSESMFNFSLHKRTRRRPIPSAEAAAEPSVTESPQQQQQQQPPPAPTSTQEEENPNSLKIPVIDDVYKCPIEGCGKSFRRENLAQMHVKHYHPKFTKYLDSTPNVADLAYARTVGESLDKSPDRLSRSAPARQAQKTITPKISTPKVNTPSPSLETETKSVSQTIDSQLTPIQKTKDSEILRLLNSKPEDNLPKYPPGLPSNMYPDIKLKDLLNKSEGIPKRDDLNLKTLSASTTRPTGIKTLLPVVRTNDKKETEAEKTLMTDNDMWPKVPINKTHLSKQNIKRKRQASENVELSKSRDNIETTASGAMLIKQETPTSATTDPSSSYIVEGGEVIKIVRMKREEIINCTCGITEEDGLMIQCELCLCWQHAYCNNIERENQVPEKYICYICQNPMRQRSSRKYFHDQDWLKNGTLPVASYHCKDSEHLKKRFEKLKKSHDMTGGLIELKDYMHSLKVKLKIAEAKNHPKLYLWSKPWEKHPLPEKIEAKPNMEDIKPKTSSSENNLSKSELDLLSSKPESQNDSMLLSILKSAKDEQKLKDELDLNTLIDNNLEQLPMNIPIIPQPEAAIESADCKLSLLEHIAHCQNLVEERLNDFERQVDELDTNSNNSEDDFGRTCQTVQMLLRDLSTLKELSHSNSL